MSAAADDPLSLSLDVLRRLPPAEVTGNVEKLMKVLPDHADDLASGVDQPLTVRIDQSKAGAGREFLCCDYNRDGESWRSWISNTWNPPLEDAADEEGPVVPTGKLRELELQANDAFETYRKLYYETGYSSTYLWDLGGDATNELPANFAGVVLFKKGTFGTWDSLHVFEVATVTGTEGTTSVQSAKYKLSSTVMLTLDRREGGVGPLGNVDLSGSLTRQVRNLVTDSETEETMKVSDAAGHVVNLGRIVEEVESKIRNQLQEIYFGKMRDVVDQLRSLEDLEASRNAKKLQEELVAGWQR